jgi:hypothetical protein
VTRPRRSTERHRVVLVRPWVDAHVGSGCCSGDPRGPIAVDPAHAAPVEHDAATRIAAAAYRLLRERFPDLDVQIVSASNTVYLLPATYAASRRRGGVLSSVGDTLRAPTAGAVLVDGERVGDVVDLGPVGVVEAVGARL